MRFPELLVVATAIILSPPPAVHAGGTVEASARAMEHSMQALGYSIEGGFKLVSGAAAIPLITAGEIGAVSGQIGHELLDEATASPHGPLPVTDEVVTVGPEQGMQNGGETVGPAPDEQLRTED